MKLLLTLSGYPNLQKELRRSKTPGAPPSLPPRNGYIYAPGALEVWTFRGRVHQWLRQTPPPSRNAKIYVNLAPEEFYTIAVTRWYPARVTATLDKSQIIKDSKTLQRARDIILPEDYGKLRNAGFTHVIDAVKGTPRLLDLSVAQRESKG